MELLLFIGGFWLFVVIVRHIVAERPARVSAAAHEILGRSAKRARRQV